LDVVERVLAAENLAFDRTDDGDLAFALTGDWKDFELLVRLAPGGRLSAVVPVGGHQGRQGHARFGPCPDQP